MNLLQALNEKVAHMGRELAKAQTTIHRQRKEIGKLKAEVQAGIARNEVVEANLRTINAVRDSALKLQADAEVRLAEAHQIYKRLQTVYDPKHRAVVAALKEAGE